MANQEYDEKPQGLKNEELENVAGGTGDTSVMIIVHYVNTKDQTTYKTFVGWGYTYQQAKADANAKWQQWQCLDPNCDMKSFIRTEEL